MTTEEAPSAVDLAHEPPFRLGTVEVRPSTRELIAGEARQVVEPRIMQVLVALARQRGEVVSRDDLIAACWSGRVVSDDAIDRCIGALRRLAERYGGFSIETITRVGYRLTETPARTGGASLRRLDGPWRVLAALLVIVLLVGSVVTWFAMRGVGRPGDVRELRVAVLPLEVQSPGPDTAYFAASLREEILTVLARNQVRVISREESAALKGVRRDEGVKRLGVGLLVDGSVERVGDTLRARLHVDDPSDKTTLWSRDFEGPASDPQLVQTRAAGRATDVVVWLMSNTYGLGAPIDRATLAAYLEAGDEIQNQGGERYLTLYRQVVARAPDFSYGHSGLGFAIARAATEAAPKDRARMLDEVRREAMTALRLDPHNGEGYSLLVLVSPPQAWSDRERLVSEGLAADPASWAVPMTYANFLAETGRVAAALAMQQRAVESVPYWARGHAALARRLADAGRTDEARAEIARVARLWPEDQDVRRIQSQLALEAALAVAPSQVRSDDPRSAVVILSRLGDLDHAFAEAERLPAVVDSYGYPDGVSLLFAPVTAPLRRDPRFLPLAARLGLLDYWRRSDHWPDFCSEPGLPYDCRATPPPAPG